MDGVQEWHKGHREEPQYHRGHGRGGKGYREDPQWRKGHKEEPQWRRGHREHRQGLLHSRSRTHLRKGNSHRNLCKSEPERRTERTVREKGRKAVNERKKEPLGKKRK